MNGNMITVGIVITTLNLIILILLTTNIIKSYLRAIDINRAISKEDLNFYFLQLLASMIFFVSNAIALYTGFITYIITKPTTMNALVYWRLADRTGMLVTAILLILIRTRYNPFTEK